jgi:hypothetical protein
MSHLLKSINPGEAIGAPIPERNVASGISEAQRAFDEFAGRQTPLWQLPPGPGWVRPGTATHVNMAYPPTIVSAMIDAGFLAAHERSDVFKVREAVMRLIDFTLGPHIAAVIAKEDKTQKAADNSWGNGPVR